MANYAGGGRQGGKTSFQQQAEQEMLHRMREKLTYERSRDAMRAEYEAAGFFVDAKGTLKKMPHIIGVFKEASVDKDFYDRGDDFT